MIFVGRGHGYPPLMKFLFLYSDKKGFPLVGSAAKDAVVNDSPVGCQSRGLTEPAGETSCQRS